MESLLLTVVALSIMVFGLISGRIQKSVITPPMVFVLFGLLAGHEALGLTTFTIENRFIHLLAEFTLVLVLFTDAARIDLRLMCRRHNLPIRLLVFGLPLTVLGGAVCAAVLFDTLTFRESLVLAAILTPTDAALGQAVICNQQVPVRIRQALNIESGLNDGIMLPVLLVLLAYAGTTGNTESVGHWTLFAGRQLVLGPLVGIGVGYAGGKLVELGSRTGWMNHTFQDLSALGLSFLAFGAAGLVGGNGFVAAFCAGLTLGNSARNICTCLYEFAEAEGQLLNLLIFMIFGAVMVPRIVDHLSWVVVLYAVLSLTLLRMVPVAMSLPGTRLRPATVLFLGWFGPRGLASILFALLVLEESSLSGGEQIMGVVTATVFLSILAHGLTAFPGARWYAAGLEKLPKADVEEYLPVDEMPVRLPYPD